MEPFEFNVAEVVASKMELLADGGDFFYLRKGEAQGAVEVVSYAISLIQTHLQLPIATDASTILAEGGIIAAGAAGSLVALNKAWEFGRKQLEQFLDNLDHSSKLYKRLTNTLTPKKKRKTTKAVPSFPIPRDIRIICNRDSENERAIPMLLALGARIRHRPKSMNAGTHRFHVNEKRFALHYKAQSQQYIGVIGDDEYLREKLKIDFLEEWGRCGRDVTR